MDEIKKRDKVEQEAIKSAVSETRDQDKDSANQELFVPSSGGGAFSGGVKTGGRGFEGMQPSMLEQEQENGQQGEYMPQETSQGDPVDYQQPTDYAEGQGYDNTSQYAPAYQSYQEAMSSDVITEISEQIVDERMSAMKDKLEKAIDFRSLAEAKINGVDKRLRRIEQIIDILQVTLIQKASEYFNDIKDVKNELIETQKSFKAISPHLKHSSHTQHGEHHTTHHSPKAHHAHPQHAAHHTLHTTHHKGKKKHKP